MRVTSAIFYLTALVSGINAQDDTLGTFTTFTDLDCSTGGEETTILDKYDSGLVSRNARALKANVQSGNCKCKNRQYLTASVTLFEENGANNK
jgi:hypothetical protein